MRRVLLACLVSSGLGAPAAAQPAPQPAPIQVERVAPGVAVLFGRGGNIGLSSGADGNVLIDDQFAPATEAVLRAVRSLDPDPVRFVINTHWHFDHTGGNERLGKAGAVIVAHDNVRRRMAVEHVSKIFGTVPPSPRGALPVVTFAQGVNFHLNGDEIHVVHVRNAHTDGDSLVHWTKGNVLHMGDTYFNKVTLPFIDIGSGGSIDGMIEAVRTGLALARPDTRIIPGHGPVATRAELESYLAMLVEGRGKVAAGKTAGQTLAQVQAAGIAAPYAVPNAFVSPDAFVEAVFESLPAAP